MPPVIDHDKCTSCGICIDICAEDVFFDSKNLERKNGNPPSVTHPEFCYHCYLCVKECPAEAIWLRTPLPMTVPYK